MKMIREIIMRKCPNCGDWHNGLSSLCQDCRDKQVINEKTFSAIFKMMDRAKELYKDYYK